MITGFTQTAIGARSTMFRWDAGTAGTMFYVYRNGALIDRTTRNWRQIDVSPGEVVEFFVSDDPAELPPAGITASTGTIEWAEADGDVQTYEIRKRVDGAWKLIGSVPNMREAWMRFPLGALADGVVNEYRVSAVDANGIPGQAREVEVMAVRVPDAVAFAIARDQVTGAMTVSF